MLTVIQPSSLTGKIWAPTSKSSMQRACAAALLRRGETIIAHPGNSNDDKAALSVIQDLGASVDTLPDGSLRIKSTGIGGTASTVNCGESGLGIRMFAPIIALSNRPVVVKGEGSLLSRPMDFFDTIFPQLGVRVISNKGRLPLEIQGPLKPSTINIDGSLSSQFLTGLLFAFAASNAKGVSIRVKDLKSKPYIDLTLQVMEHFGWLVENRNYQEFVFSASPVRLGDTLRYTVEGDWSGGAFLLVAGALAGPVTVMGLDTGSTQADKAILGALRDSGATLVEADDGGLETGPSKTILTAFSFDATDCPDLFPPLVALAACCAGTTTIKGVGRLAHKESDRALTLQAEFNKMGVAIELKGDCMLVKGGGQVKAATVHSRHDHRIAMAEAVVALRADGPVTIEEAEAIKKSYPDFYEDLKKMGAGVVAPH